jgi:hypothetical protein
MAEDMRAALNCEWPSIRWFLTEEQAWEQFAQANPIQLYLDLDLDLDTEILLESYSIQQRVKISYSVENN